ncbi:MAG: class I SAM-dependent methyltransferase [Proteobacteria bacterium]|nr:class I SAM-dependent methyltransferase [Pseudomonadota bacterium]
MLRTRDEFPGHANARAFLEGEIARRGSRTVADIGAGANPVIPPDSGARSGLDYTIIDISAVELAKAPPGYRRVCADIATPGLAQSPLLGGKRFDLVFTHMLHEHLKDPLTAHRNIFDLLAPGGVAIHLFPSPNNLPLFLNKVLPPAISHAAMRVLQPIRARDGRRGKFPAYYRLCGAPSARLNRTFESLGYVVEEHTGFIGHNYYRRIPLLRTVERRLRPLLAAWNAPVISNVKLVLRKPL